MNRATLLIYLLLMLAFFLTSTTVHAAGCSDDIGDATINEVYELGNSYWIEVKMIDPTVSYAGWQLKLCREQGNKDNCGSYAIGGLVLQNTNYLVLSGIDKKHIDINKNAESDILLVDSDGKAVDYLSINDYTYQQPTSCAFKYPTEIETTSSNKKGIFRSPDGTGSWMELEGSGATGDPTQGGSNDGDDGDDELPTCDDLVISAIGTQIAGVKSGEEYTVCINDFEGSPYYSFDYFCIDPGGCVGELHISDTRDEGDCHYYKLQFDDVGKIKLDISITIDDELLICSSNDFVVKPHHFNISEIVCSDSTVNPEAEDSAGGVFCRAGADFTVTITAENAANETTQNFGHEDNPQAVALNYSLIAPAGGSSGVFTSSLSGDDFDNGVAQDVTLSWSEVGIITLTPVALNYLSAGSVNGDESVNIGRFIPDRFEIEDILPATLVSACNNFTYTGQTIEGYVADEAPQFTIRALNALTPSQTTQNYTGDFAKLEASDIDLNGPIDGADADQLGADGISKVQVYTLLETGNLVDNNDGTLTYTASYDDEFMYQRDNALISPFKSLILLQLDAVEDSDGAAATGLPLDVEVGGTEIRYGRLALDNAHGSELLPLSVPLRAEYYNGLSFVQNVDDSCTPYADTHLLLDSYTGNLSVGDTTVSGSGSLNSAAGVFSLTAPGSGNDGGVRLEYDLGTSAADLPWLQFDWKGDGSQLNPTAKATFGIFKGNPNLIYTRESVW